MSYLETVPYKTALTIKDKLKTPTQNITLSRYLCESDKCDRYYLRVNIIENGKSLNQGYLYFYLEPTTHESKFVGASIKDEYRNSGLCSLLISSWIDLTLNDGFINLSTNPKQKKPFLLYLLKKYAFEVTNLNTYLTSDKVVYICKKHNDYNHKYISFKSIQEERRFKTSNIMKTDNYEIVNRDDEAVEILDSVALYTPYYLQSQEKAYQKALKTYQKHL